MQKNLLVLLNIAATARLTHFYPGFRPVYGCFGQYATLARALPTPGSLQGNAFSY